MGSRKTCRNAAPPIGRSRPAAWLSLLVALLMSGCYGTTAVSQDRGTGARGLLACAPNPTSARVHATCYFQQSYEYGFRSDSIRLVLFSDARYRLRTWTAEGGMVGYEAGNWRRDGEVIWFQPRSRFHRGMTNEREEPRAIIVDERTLEWVISPAIDATDEDGERYSFPERTVRLDRETCATLLEEAAARHRVLVAQWQEVQRRLRQSRDRE